MSRPPLRLLHTSDVHLGAYETRDTEHDISRRTEMREMFRRVIDLGLREHVDLMVIAGDFFDHAHVQEETMRFAADQIARLEAPVVLVPGNHDHVGPGSVYDRMDLAALAKNLVITRDPAGESVLLESLGVEVWGRSHTEQDPDFAPLAGAPARNDAPWHIGVAHGHYIHPRALLSGSFHIFKEDFGGLDFDYVALGHWEVQSRVDGGDVTAAYSGAPEGMIGIERRRALIVDLVASGDVRLSSHSLMSDDQLDHADIPLLGGMTRDAALRERGRTMPPGRGAR